VRKTLLSAAVAAFVSLLVPSGEASADVIWNVTGTFDDGTSLTGSFTINVYGNLESWDLKTQTKGVFSSWDYTPGTSFLNGTGVPPFSIGMGPNSAILGFLPYEGDFFVEFADPLTTPEANNPIVGNGTSFECQVGWSCPSDGFVRYLDGHASAEGSNVPEPVTLSLFGAGLAGAVAMRRRKKQTV
jgi:hypothetical protein